MAYQNPEGLAKFEKVAVRNLRPGDILASGVTVVRVYQQIGAQPGYLIVETKREGDHYPRRTEWNADTHVNVLVEDA